MILSYGNSSPTMAGDRTDAWAKYHKVWAEHKSYTSLFNATWMPIPDFTDFKWYEIQGNRTADKLNLRNRRIEAANLLWYAYFDRLFRNFNLDFGSLTNADRIAKVKDMPAVARAMNMQKLNADGTPYIDIDPSAPLMPGAGDAAAAAQYDKTLETTETDIKDKILKYAPGIAAGVAIFKLLIK